MPKNGIISAGKGT